jgi:hypothetical protein
MGFFLDFHYILCPTPEGMVLAGDFPARERFITGSVNYINFHPHPDPLPQGRGDERKATIVNQFFALQKNNCSGMRKHAWPGFSPILAVSGPSFKENPFLLVFL